MNAEAAAAGSGARRRRGRRRWWAAAGVAVAGLALAVAFRHREPPAVTWDAVAVRRGALDWRLHEAGELQPRDPVLVKVPFVGRIQTVVADGDWVDAGQVLFTLSEEDEVKRVTDDRATLLSARQDLQLAQLKRADTAATEDRKLLAVKRAAGLEEERWRIATATPVLGDELLKLDAALRPIDADIARLRGDFERTQDAWQQAQDAWFDALDAVQGHRDAVSRAQSRCDELTARRDAGAEAETAVERDAAAKAGAELPAALAELADARQGGDELERRLAAAKAARDAAQGPRDRAAAALAAREADAEELHVRIEIEKRGLPTAELQLDRQAAQVKYDEAVRQRDQGRASFAGGALGAVAMEDLEAAVTRAKDQLDVVGAQLEISARPPAPEVVAEAVGKRDRARARAAAAQADHDRALALADQDIAVLQAKVARLEAGIATSSARFPALLETAIEANEKELAALPAADAAGIQPEDLARRRELSDQLAAQRDQLAEAKRNPPNIVRAPCPGVARVQHEGDRHKQPGDKAWERDVLVELFPPGNLQALLRVNEVDVRHLAPGMPASVTVPTLQFTCGGTVAAVAAVGHDLSAPGPDGGDAGPFADVTQFDAQVRLDATREDFRQGMTALVEVQVEHRDDALWLPLAAVHRTAGGAWAVWRPGRDPVEAPVAGAPFGDDAFILSDAALGVGDQVLIRRDHDL
jgi:hypothetical protein